MLKVPTYKTTIGRAKSNTISIEDDFSSRVHCTIQLVDGRYVLQDNGSRNGTKINGNPIAGPVEMNKRGSFQIGQTTFIFSVNDPRSDPNWLAGSSATKEAALPISPLAEKAAKDAAKAAKAAKKTDAKMPLTPDAIFNHLKKKPGPAPAAEVMDAFPVYADDEDEDDDIPQLDDNELFDPDG